MFQPKPPHPDLPHDLALLTASIETDAAPEDIARALDISPADLLDIITAPPTHAYHDASLGFIQRRNQHHASLALGAAFARITDILRAPKDHDQTLRAVTLLTRLLRPQPLRRTITDTPPTTAGSEPRASASGPQPHAPDDTVPGAAIPESEPADIAPITPSDLGPSIPHPSIPSSTAAPLPFDAHADPNPDAPTATTATTASAPSEQTSNLPEPQPQHADSTPSLPHSHLNPTPPPSSHTPTSPLPKPAQRAQVTCHRWSKIAAGDRSQPVANTHGSAEALKGGAGPLPDATDIIAPAPTTPGNQAPHGAPTPAEPASSPPNAMLDTG